MLKVGNKTYNTDVEQVLTLLSKESSYFKDIKNVGDYVMTNCPYHKDGQERKPSCGFKKSTGYMHCFTCGEKKSLNDVIYKITNKSAQEWLEELFEVEEIEEVRKVDLFKKKTEKEEEQKEKIDVSKYRVFHPYMFERKLTKDVIRKYDIGYADGCIIFPNKDEDGNILFLAKRSVNSKFFNYPRNAEKPIYGLYELNRDFPDTTYVIVCESMLDALTFVVAGKPAVALNGLGSSSQIAKLNKLKQRKIILCTDMDENGLLAREKIAKKLKNKLVYEYNLPKKDANECTIEELKNLKETKFYFKRK